VCITRLSITAEVSSEIHPRRSSSSAAWNAVIALASDASEMSGCAATAGPPIDWGRKFALTSIVDTGSSAITLSTAWCKKVRPVWRCLQLMSSGCRRNSGRKHRSATWSPVYSKPTEMHGARPVSVQGVRINAGLRTRVGEARCKRCKELQFEGSATRVLATPYSGCSLQPKPPWPFPYITAN
jgi:hypothetical protein